MARRPSPPPVPATLTAEQMRLGIDRLQRRLEDVKHFEPQSVKEQHNTPHVEALSASVEDALVRTFGTHTTDYNLYRDAAFFDNGPFNYARAVPIWEVHASLERSKARSLALLGQAIASLNERLHEVSSASEQPIAPMENLSENKKVFVVHGHDEGPRESVARFLATLGFTPVILHEQANQGRTIIEKIEAHGAVGFAVVLLTPDDVGRAKGADSLQPRARQNVVLELGIFIAKLGRNRVCVLKRGALEVPSDYAGVVYEPYDDGSAWKQALARELEAAGYEIDWNKVMRR